MMYSRLSRNGFTLIELLVVVLVIGILLALAVPAYLSWVRGGRAKTANSNARAIAVAVQARYVRSGGTTYATYTAANMDGDAALKADLGGTVPVNPCVGPGTFAASYTIVPSAPGWTIIPVSGANCDAGDLVMTSLGNP